MHIQLAEDLGRVEKVLVLIDPAFVSSIQLYPAIRKKTHFFALNANSGRLSTMASQYPLMINKKVKKAWTAASGTM